jgi:hypothetical protein
MKKSTKVGLAVGGVVLAALIALGVYEEMKKPAAQTTGGHSEAAESSGVLIRLT